MPRYVMWILNLHWVIWCVPIWRRYRWWMITLSLTECVQMCEFVWAIKTQAQFVMANLSTVSPKQHDSLNMLPSLIEAPHKLSCMYLSQAVRQLGSLVWVQKWTGHCVPKRIMHMLLIPLTWCWRHSGVYWFVFLSNCYMVFSPLFCYCWNSGFCLQHNVLHSLLLKSCNIWVQFSM